ncbi:MAG: hypothetical protein ACRC4G_01950 [Alphaproteobacteria bacterium]
MDKKSRIAMMALWGLLVQPVQAAEQPNVLEEIYKFGDHTLCPIICNPPLLFPPVLCKITEIKKQCLKKCSGVTYLGGKKAIDLTGCRAAIDRPFVQAAGKTMDQFCWWACNRKSCSDFTISIPTKEGFVDLPWPGKTFGNTICRAFCKKEKIAHCLKSAGEFNFEILQRKPVELP